MNKKRFVVLLLPVASSGMRPPNPHSGTFEVKDLGNGGPANVGLQWSPSRIVWRIDALDPPYSKDPIYLTSLPAAEATRELRRAIPC